MDRSPNQIDLTFHGAKRIPANVLASKSRLSVDGYKIGNRSFPSGRQERAKSDCILFQNKKEAMDGENLNERETHCIRLHRQKLERYHRRTDNT